jgi:tetratricopeptide (TPR) repeat protein
MTFLAILAVAAVAAMLFQARGVIAVILCNGKLRAGDYDAALRRVRWASLGVPNPLLLHREALTLAFADRPAEAERCYRKALGLVEGYPSYRWERLHTSLGYTLIDLARHDDAEGQFRRAIEMGDLTGNPQAGLAELLLVGGVGADRALDYADQAIEQARRREGGRVPGGFHACRAWALGVLSRGGDAREPLAESLRTTEPLPHARACQHWLAGMTLTAMGEGSEARQHFQEGRDVDPRGKYGHRCGERL